MSDYTTNKELELTIQPIKDGILRLETTMQKFIDSSGDFEKKATPVLAASERFQKFYTKVAAALVIFLIIQAYNPSPDLAPEATSPKVEIIKTPPKERITS